MKFMNATGAAIAVLTFVFAAAPATAQQDEPDKIAPPPQPRSIVDQKDDPADKDAPPQASAAGRLIAYARDLRVNKGCAAAAPTYRVVAGMGEGQESAQQELGECLLDMKGANETETALFRQEGRFWLTRAAFAGDARAQRRLVLEMAAPTNPLHDPNGALKWALVYDNNPTADLYGYKALPSTLVPGLKSSLAPADIVKDEAFAANFTPITLGKYEAPKPDKKKSKPRKPQGSERGGHRRR